MRPEPTAAPRPFGDYLPELDGVRAIAFLLVLWYHLPLSLHGEAGGRLVAWLDVGYFGVDVFFVLSGFVVTRVLLLDRDRGVPLRSFYLRRALRILPIYYLVLAVVALVDPFAELWWCALHVANYRQIAGGNLQYLGHLWSLSVEEHFYLVWPFALLLAGRGRAPLAALAMFAVCAASVWYYFAHGHERLVIGMTEATTTRLRAMLLGALFAFWEGGIRTRPWRSTAIAGGMVVASVACTEWCLIGSGIAQRIVDSGMPEPGRLRPVFQLAGYALSSGAVVLLAIAWSGRRAPHAALLRLSPLRWVGTISYGLYLYHLPVLFAFGRPELDADTTSARMRALLAIAATFAVAALSFRFVERPLIRLGRRGRGGAPSPGSVRLPPP